MNANVSGTRGSRRGWRRWWKWVLWVMLGAVLLTGAGAVVWADMHPVEYHCMAVEFHAYRPHVVSRRGYFKRDYLLWTLMGRRSEREVFRSRVKHLRVLRDMGYLVELKYDVPNTITDESLDRLMLIKEQFRLEGKLRNKLGWIYGEGTKSLTVAVPEEEVAVWEEIVKRFQSGVGMTEANVAAELQTDLSGTNGSPWRRGK